MNGIYSQAFLLLAWRKFHSLPLKERKTQSPLHVIRVIVTAPCD